MIDQELVEGKVKNWIQSIFYLCPGSIFVNGCINGNVKQIFHKSRLCKLRVSPTETAMNDVFREVNT